MSKTLAAKIFSLPATKILIGSLLIIIYFVAFLQIRDTTDTINWRHWASINFAFGSSVFDLSVISPVQGLGGLTLPLGVWLHPSYVLPHLFQNIVDPSFFNPLIGIILLFLATILLGIASGLPSTLAIICSQVYILIAFGSIRLMGVVLFDIVPSTIAIVALCNIILALFYLLGSGSKKKNAIIVVLLPIVTIYTVVSNPLYTAMFIIPSVVFGCGIIFGSESRQALVWRLIGLGTCIVVFLSIDLPKFYYALKSYTARDAFPNELYTEVQDWDYLTSLFFQFPSGSFIIALAFVSILVTLIWGSRQEKGFVLSVLFYIILMVGVSLIYVYSGVRWSLPLPVYLELGGHTGYIVSIFLGIRVLYNKINADFRSGETKRYHKFANRRLFGLVSIFMVSALPYLLIHRSGNPLFFGLYSGMFFTVMVLYSSLILLSFYYTVRFSNFQYFINWIKRSILLINHVLLAHPLSKIISALFIVPILFFLVAFNGVKQEVHENTDKVHSRFLGNQNNILTITQNEDSIFSYLKNKLFIFSGSPFRGSVASVVGVPGDPVANQLGYPPNAPFTKSSLGSVIDYLPGTFDKNLWLTGLWNQGIPTLEENNHLVTLPFHFLYSRVFSRDIDYHSRNWVFLTKINTKIMAAMGARFLMTDKSIVDLDLTLRKEQTNEDGITLRLYEFDKPNLADFSPTRVRYSSNAREMLSIMASKAFSFEEEAILVERISDSLVSAENSNMYFEKGGIIVKAFSTGTSLLLLPVQFSNSLNIISKENVGNSKKPKLIRTNLLLTGVLFSGQIEIKIAHVFGLFRDVKGRILDIEESRALGIHETGGIPYPPNYQPKAIR
jgi:hypothetical protein